jgi:nucleoside-diphosphate-sugar epimerase
MDAAKNSSILVTGAQGFIGRAVGKLLRQEGFSVLAVDQVALEPGVASSSAGHEILLDITDAEGLRRIFDSREIVGVVHLAAILPTVAQQEPLRATQVNVVGSVHLLELAREFGARRFVFGSSLSAYGTHPADQVVSEESNAAPEDVYGASKLYVEQLGSAYRERFGLEFVSLRIGRVLGPGARSATSAWRSQIFEFQDAKDPVEISVPYLDSERLLLVHIDDVAKALVTLLRADHVSHAVYNAPCESVIVGDLKQQVERSNSNIKIRLGDAYVRCNPRLVDWSRFGREFRVSVEPIFVRLAKEAG